MNESQYLRFMTHKRMKYNTRETIVGNGVNNNNIIMKVENIVAKGEIARFEQFLFL